MKNPSSNHNELLKAIVDGDKIAFRKLYELFSDKVYNTALSYVQNKQDAEEVTQDVFTNIFRKVASFKGGSSLSTWVYRITINTSLNHINKRKRNSFFALSNKELEKPDFVHPGVLLENKEKAKALFKAIESLSANQKTAFILSFIEELPRQEVADIMEISLKAVESLLQRAKSNLKLKLEKDYPNRRK